MNREAIARYALFGMLLAGCIVLLALSKDVPDWLIAITSGLGGNTVRLQVSAPKKEE